MQHGELGLQVPFSPFLNLSFTPSTDLLLIKEGEGEETHSNIYVYLLNLLVQLTVNLLGAAN